MFGGEAPFFEAALKGSFAVASISMLAATQQVECEDVMRRVVTGCGAILKRWSIWSTVQHSPGIETLLAIKGLYLF